MELTMRAEHRHELKTNELAELIGEVPIWVKQHLRTIIYVSAVVVFVAGYYVYYRYQTTVVARREQANLTSFMAQLPMQKMQIARAQVEGEDASFALSQMANSLQNIAGETKQDAVAALAIIKEAEILRTELHFRVGTLSQQDLVNQLTRAKAEYTKAIDIYLKRNPDPTLSAMAKFGLGLCEEELGNSEQARKIYNEVATSGEYEGTPAAAAAKRRLAVMNYFNQTISLKPAPKPPVAVSQQQNAGAQLQPTPPAEAGQTPSTIPQVELAPEANTQGLIP
jgi:tetratricopeptide (TPR) repeat protein